MAEPYVPIARYTTANTLLTALETSIALHIFSFSKHATFLLLGVKFFLRINDYSRSRALDFHFCLNCNQLCGYAFLGIQKKEYPCS